MSCCGCASRVLKLQSEIRSWKNKLADERREKKMILRWIMAVFGYDVKVDIDKDTHGVRVQATENKEAVAKALIKLGIGSGDGDFGMMIMELKLENDEFYEPFEDPYEAPEFPILEINSMSTQAPIVNTGIQSLGPITHPPPGNPQSLSIATPLEVQSAGVVSSGGHNDQEVLYLAGSLEEGATIEGPNGQSYIIIRASESEEVPVPMQLDYSTIISDEVDTSGNMFFRLASSAAESGNVINYLSTSQKFPGDSTQLSLPTVVTPIIQTVGTSSAAYEPDMKSDIKVIASTSLSTQKSPPKKKAKCVPEPLGSMPSTSAISKKKKSEQKNNFNRAASLPSKSATSGSSNKSKTSQQSQVHTDNSKVKQVEPIPVTSRKDGFEFGLTLREKAEIYVMQKAKEAVEKLGNGFRCTVCEENRYTYTNLDTAIAHTKTHFESKPYKCEFCDELFPIQRELLSHRKTAHPKPKGTLTNMSSRLTQGRPSNMQPSSSSVLSESSGGDIRSSQTRTIVVQAPYDKDLLSGPISISSDVLAALLRAGSSTITVSSSDLTGKMLKSGVPTGSKFPTIVIGTESGKPGVGAKRSNLTNVQLNKANVLKS